MLTDIQYFSMYKQCLIDSHGLSLSEGCKRSLVVWAGLSAFESAGERLLWHPICGPRQAKGEFLYKYEMLAGVPNCGN